MANEDVWVVVPAFNEAATIGQVVHELRSAYPHVAVVDDGSGDDTARVARRAGATVLRHPLNRGQGAALQTGLTFALDRGAAFLVTFDADGQHRVEDVARLLAPLRAGRAEIALGSRFLGSTEGMPPGRRWLLRGAVLFTRFTSGLKLSDAHNGLRALSRRAASHVRLTLDRMAHASEILDQIRSSRLPFVEVPVTIRYTAYSRGKGQSALGAVDIALNYLASKVLR